MQFPTLWLLSRQPVSPHRARRPAPALISPNTAVPAPPPTTPDGAPFHPELALVASDTEVTTWTVELGGMRARLAPEAMRAESDPNVTVPLMTRSP